MKKYDEIIKSFECCNKPGGCDDCVYDRDDDYDCVATLNEDVLEALKKLAMIGDCVKTAAWENAYNELQMEAKEAKLGRENLSLKQELNTVRSQRAEACEAKAQEVQKRMALGKELDAQRKENADLFREHRETLDKLDEYQRQVAGLKKDNRELGNAKADLEQTLKAAMEIKDRYMKERDKLVSLWQDEESTALTRWAKAIHENAVAHGWWAKSAASADDFHSPAGAGESGAEDGDRPFPEIVALCHSELSEALEEYRSGRPLAYVVRDNIPREDMRDNGVIITDPERWEKGDKPEGIAVEMIDCIIRILDWCGKEGIDVDAVLRRKHEYNKSRPYRHGGKKA